jgi:hypothetical protein
LWRRPRPKLGCGAKERKEGRKKALKEETGSHSIANKIVASSSFLRESNFALLALFPNTSTSSHFQKICYQSVNYAGGERYLRLEKPLY